MIEINPKRKIIQQNDNKFYSPYKINSAVEICMRCPYKDCISENFCDFYKSEYKKLKQENKNVSN